MTLADKPTNLFSDKLAKYFFVLALSYLLLGLLLGVAGGFQYIFPEFLKEKLGFQKTRPLHVYLVITWIFTAAQAGLYYYITRVAGKKLFWTAGGWLHFILQTVLSLTIVICFFWGYFGGREYLEFPPIFGLFIIIGWILFAINFFGTLKPNYKTAPVYIWSWSTGIIFFFITFSEAYLWIYGFFNNNIVRDVTIQWKAMGSMVGSWNMLIYGTGMYVMEKISGDTKPNRSPVAFFFYFLGLTNLMFNWGHHTYIVPAAPWVKQVAFVISMTELIILAHIITTWQKTVTEALKNYHNVAYRLLSYADFWIFLNLALSITISIPSINFYTHGTHITVAHAMGATIGINTLLLMASVFYIIQDRGGVLEGRFKKRLNTGIVVFNISFMVFWVAMIGSGLVKIASKLNNDVFAVILEKCKPWFKVFTYGGAFTFIGLLILIIAAIVAFNKKAVQ